MKNFSILFLLLSLSNCLVMVHTTKLAVPVENGFQYRCKKTGSRDVYVECREDYLAKKYILRDQSRDMIRTTTQYRKGKNSIETWIPRK